MASWKTVYESDYLGSVDLVNGKLTLTFAHVGKELVTGDGGRKENCVVGHFTDINMKPMILNRTNCKKMQKLTGSADMDAWKNVAIELGCEKVKFQGEIVDGLRIKGLATKGAKTSAPATDQTTEALICAECGKEITAGYGMTAKQIAEKTLGKYKKMLCTDCASKVAKE